MSDLTLYNITNKFAELMDMAENGELTEEQYNALGEQLTLELQQKGSGIIGYTQNEEAFIEAVDFQIKRLQDLKKARQNKLEKFNYEVTEKNDEEKENLEEPSLIINSPLSSFCPYF